MIETYIHIKLAEKRMSQKELSEATGIRAATISGYCSGNYKHMVKEHLDIFCEFFNCQISDLIEYVPTQPQKN